MDVPRLSPRGALQNYPLGPLAAPGATWATVLRVERGTWGSGLGPRGTELPRTAATPPRWAPWSLSSGTRAPPPGCWVSAPGLTSRGSAPKLTGRFATKVEIGRTRNPRKMVGAISTGSGGKGDLAAGPPPGPPTACRPPPRRRDAHE